MPSPFGVRHISLNGGGLVDLPRDAVKPAFVRSDDFWAASDHRFNMDSSLPIDELIYPLAVVPRLA